MTECTKDWQTMGSLFPSSRHLAKAMTSCIPAIDSATQPRKILEVGAGTGAITAELVHKLAPSDKLVIYELSSEFAHVLVERTEHDPDWKGKNIELRVAAFPELIADETYDFAICSLPFNNFSSTMVKRTMAKFSKILAGGGTLAFYEYCHVRRLKLSVTDKISFMRLKRIDRIMEQYLAQHRISKKTVRLNLPPAWVHILKFE